MARRIPQIFPRTARCLCVSSRLSSSIFSKLTDGLYSNMACQDAEVCADDNIFLDGSFPVHLLTFQATIGRSVGSRIFE